jgi:hypothetical protein
MSDFCQNDDYGWSWTRGGRRHRRVLTRMERLHVSVMTRKNTRLPRVSKARLERSLQTADVMAALTLRSETT